MDWKLELDALIENTVAFANHVKRKPIPDLPVAMKTAEEAPQPVAPPVTITPILLATSERDEIRQRVSNFKAHQERFAREREDFAASQIKRMLVDPTALGESGS